MILQILASRIKKPMNKNSVRGKFFTYMLHSYIVYSHLDQALFINFSSGKELGG